MGYAVQWLRSLLFVSQMYLMMAVLAVFFTPWAIVDRRGAYAGIHTYCRWVRWTAAWMVGLRSEVRGEIPQGRGADRRQAPELLRHHPDLLGGAAAEVHHEEGTEVGADPGLVCPADRLRAGRSRQARRARSSR
jgi:hypothetical protein